MTAEPVPPTRRALRGPRRPERTGWSMIVRETAIILVSALVLSFLVKTFLAQAFYIPSGSMENTLLVGDRVMVNKLAPGPFTVHRGDIVVFKDPGGWLPPTQKKDRSGLGGAVTHVLTFVGLLPQDSGEHLIKRVIGVAGDHVACCDSQGRLTVNGVAIEEPYLAPGAEPSELAFSVTVRPDSVWVMGDNRSNSRDSRYNQDNLDGGSVPLDDVVGVAFATLWPPGHMGLLRNPGSTFAHVPGPNGS